MEFFDVLVRYEVGLWAAIERELSRQKLLGLGQLHALRVVDRYNGAARVQDLTEAIGITVGAASKLVDRLERDGLVTRGPNPANRRSSLITLTAVGRESLSTAADVAEAVVGRATAGQDLPSLTAALTRLQVQLTELRTEVAA